MQAPSLPLLSPRSATVAGTDMGGVEAEARIWEAAASRPAGLLSVAECAFHPHHQHHRWIEPGIDGVGNMKLICGTVLAE